MKSFISSLIAQKLKISHNIDRQLHSRLVELGFDPPLSLRILAFWNWLETCGYSNVASNLLQLSDGMLYVMGKEAFRCNYFLTMGMTSLPYVPLEFELRYMPSFLGSDFSLWFVHENREIARLELRELVEGIRETAFRDLVMVSPLLSHIESPSAEELFLRKERTLFVTSSEGYPIFKGEFIDFIIRKFGNCVDNMLMKDEPEIEPVFARIVLVSREAIIQILRGEKVAILSVNGRDFLARRFMPMREINTHHRRDNYLSIEKKPT